MGLLSYLRIRRNSAKAVTRGNGQVGEVITGNARMFDNVPLQIPFQGELVLRGEAVITYSRFREINESLRWKSNIKIRVICAAVLYASLIAVLRRADM